MKFTTDMKTFRAGLAFAGKVILPKSPIPIALCVKIVTNDNRVTITGTNFDTSFEMNVAADVETEGVTVISFAALNAFCAAAKTESLTIEADKDRATVKAGKSRITIASMDQRDFPNYLPAEGELATIDGPTFCAALRFCAASCSDEEARYYLQGVYAQPGSEALDLWATDGHALHHAAIADLPNIGGGGIVPAEAATIICTIGEKASDFAIMVSDRGWHVRAGALRAWGKVIDGTFPDAKRLVAGFKGSRDVISIGNAELAAALTVATCGADTSANKARSLIVKAKDGEPLVVRGARGASGIIAAGRAETETRAVAEAACAVSSALLTRALSAMQADDVILSAGQDVLRLRPSQESAVVSSEAIVMCMRATPEEMADA